MTPHRNGTSWRSTSLPNTASTTLSAPTIDGGGQLTDIVALSPSNIVAVGTTGGGGTPLVLHWNGSSWARETTAQIATLTARRSTSVPISSRPAPSSSARSVPRHAIRSPATLSARYSSTASDSGSAQCRSSRTSRQPRSPPDTARPVRTGNPRERACRDTSRKSRDLPAPGLPHHEQRAAKTVAGPIHRIEQDLNLLLPPDQHRAEHLSHPVSIAAPANALRVRHGEVNLPGMTDEFGAPARSDPATVGKEGWRP